MRAEKRGRKYYIYQSVRTEDGPTTRYIGNNWEGQLALLVDGVLKDARRYEKQDAETLARYAEAADDPLEDAFDVAFTYSWVLLKALGYHRRNYEFRRRRGVSSWRASEVPFPPDDTPYRPSPHEIAATPIKLPAYMAALPAYKLPFDDSETPDDGPNDPLSEGATPGGDPSLGNFLDLELGTSTSDIVRDMEFDDQLLGFIKAEFRQAKRMRAFLDNAGPNQKSADTVRRFLARKPEIWRNAGLLNRLAAHFLTTMIPQDLPEERDAALLAMDEIRLAMGWEAAPVHERVLIDQVALSLFAYQVTALIFSAFTFKSSEKPHLADYWEHRLDASMRRLQRATTTLVRVRKLTRATKAVQGDLAAYLNGLSAANEDLSENLAPVDGEPGTTNGEPSPADRSTRHAVDEPARPADSEPRPDDSEGRPVDSEGRAGRGATFEPGLRWGPFGSVRTAEQIVQDRARAQSDPAERLRRAHRYAPSGEMKAALEAYYEQSGYEAFEPSPFSDTETWDDSGSDFGDSTSDNTVSETDDNTGSTTDDGWDDDLYDRLSDFYDDQAPTRDDHLDDDTENDAGDHRDADRGAD